MSESGQPEAAAPAPAEPRVASPVPQATVVGAFLLLVAGVAIGGLGIYAFVGGREGPTATEPAEFDAGDVGSRVGALGGGTAVQDGGIAETAETGVERDTGAGGAAEVSPADEVFAAKLAEEEARLAERARLAWDSPLTPPVTDAAELVEQWRSGDPEALPAPGLQSEAPADAGTGNVPALQDRTASRDEASTATIGGGEQAHVLARGSVIPAVLESSIDSDLPGLVRAKVAETVFDTVTGRHVLIPRGSWLVGTYGSEARTGQRRLFVSWTDLLLPDGTPVPLGGTGSLGADGASGVKGRRSTGLWTALGAAVLFDLAGNASQILIAAETGEAPGRQGGLAELLGAALGNSTSQVSERYLGEILERGTRFRVDAGARMNVLVEEDLHLNAQGAL